MDEREGKTTYMYDTLCVFVNSQLFQSPRSEMASQPFRSMVQYMYNRVTN